MRSYPRRSKRLTAAGKSGRYRRYARVAWGSRWMNEVITRRRSMTGVTEPGTWSRVKRSASGKSSQKTSRHRSPPRIPVSQSCTSATLMAGVAGARSARRGPGALAPVAQEVHDVGRAQPGRVDLDRDALDRGLLEEEIQHLLDGPRAARAEIVHFAWLSLLQQQPVAADDVAHVGIVAPRLEIAHVDDGLPEAGLDLGDLLGEVGGHEDIAAPRPLVVEAARPDDRHAVALEVLVAHHVLGDLAHRIWGQGPQRVGLLDRQLVLVDQAVLLAAAHGKEARRHLEPADAFEEVHLGDDIGRQGLGRRLPGGADEALSGQMHDVRRLGGFEQHPHRGQVAKIRLDQRDLCAQMLDVLGLAPPSARAEHLGALPEGVLRHVASDESRDSRDQQSHVRIPTARASIMSNTGNYTLGAPVLGP